MNELIQIQDRRIGDDTIQTVNARDLHAFLEIGKDFSTWIKDRIEQYNFVEGHDYVTAEILSPPKLGSSKARPQRAIEYHLSIDMAKELSMVERNKKGKEARQYFIECERQTKQIHNPMEILNDPVVLRQALLGYSEKVMALEAKVKEQTPLVDFARQVEISKDAISVAQAAKILGTGQQRLFSFLRQIGWITRRNEPYQSKIEAGYLDVKLGSWEHPNHGLRQSVTTLVTGKGLSYIQKHIQEQRNVG